jgi:hypothetical protein
VTVEYTLVGLAATLEAAPQPIVHSDYRDTPTNRLLAHSDFLDWFYDSTTPENIRRKALFVLQTLMSRGYAQRTKAVTGDGKGWLRAGLGGNNGFQWYAWYATAQSEVGTRLGLDRREVAVRVVRHHDDTHLALDPGTKDVYADFSPSDVQTGDERSNFTQQQRDIALQRNGPCTTIRGFPGAGKTTALLLSGVLSPGQRVLYLTFSSRLAEEASRFFGAFQPKDTDFEVMTLAELLNQVDQRGLEMPVIETQVDTLAELLRVSKKWALNVIPTDAIVELHSEFHSYVVGHSLPVPFGKLTKPAGEFLDAAQYREIRGGEVGEEFAKTVETILEDTAIVSALESFASGPLRARQALRDIAEPPPPRLAGFSTILVDEVQDLTVVEAAFVLNVIGRIAAASGTMPRLLFAGDESQTVRPTDFKWATLRPLIKHMLGDASHPQDEVLDTNLRSPKDIAAFVQATRDQYSKFDKEDRPSGLTYTSSEETEKGRVIYTVVHDDTELELLVETFEKLARAAIVYPGNRLPADLPEHMKDNDVFWTAATAKGLDFDSVAVLDAGRRLDDLDKMIAANATSKSDGGVNVGRTLADQFRVAVSRSTSNLVLVDRSGNDHFAAIQELCKEYPDLDLESLTVDELVGLSEEELDPIAAISNIVDSVWELLNADLDRCILRLRTLKRHVDRATAQLTLPEETIDAIARARGVVLLAAAMQPHAIHRTSNDEVLDLLKRHVSASPMGATFESLADFHTLLASNRNWCSEELCDGLTAVADKVADVRLELPEVIRVHENRLIDWIDALKSRSLPVDDTTVRRVIKTAAALIAALSEQHRSVEDMFTRAVIKWVDSATAQRADISLELLAELPTRDYSREARCHEARKDWREAANSYVSAADFESAIRAARRIPDISLALNLARQSNSGTTATLEWLNTLGAHFARMSERELNTLTPEERQLLTDWTKGKRLQRTSQDSSETDSPF